MVNQQIETPHNNRRNGRRNEPRFLDYRRSPLPLDVALSFLPLPAQQDRSTAVTPRQLVLAGKVHVNGLVETSCHRLVCRYHDKIAVDDVELKRPISLPSYFVCYKPRGIVCSNKRNEGIDREDAVYISDWLSQTFMNRRGQEVCASFDMSDVKSINTVGRLDEESEGLLLLTNDGSFSRLLCDPEFGLSKTYRVVAKGSGYSSLLNSLLQEEGSCPDGEVLARRITEMIDCGNTANFQSSSKSHGTPSKLHFPYENCTVFDVGKLPSQHSSDDSYYALLDLTLREGKTHAVRRIIKNSGLRVFYLSRIQVEGLCDSFAVVKPRNLVEVVAGGFSGGLNSINKDGTLFSDHRDDSLVTLEPGDVVALKSWHVDRIFSLRS
ncbi:hypothetical protein HJC23_011770 [Cyclotella cryptica]|uniref:Pseudouridine synthase RsuA/RluA-like domain-containing protein n=1 Tax=Cyclotella cryptica TaxID=29204 RepID=A0ABD3PIG4_9STRA|eukprot:CCRYP_014816-RA/>CCRYP_014816-RA protein AED:0.00 eAED:0.00 QI:168/-1/1/1/-1/1/1/194/379